MAEVSPAEIADQRNLLVVASTWGEGDPPERAAEFYKALMAEDAPRFDGVRFAVLALGDLSYVNFCEVGRRIDLRLEALGGERIAPRIDATWTTKVRRPGRAARSTSWPGAPSRTRQRSFWAATSSTSTSPRRPPCRLFQGQSVPRRDHREHQSQQQPLDQADDPSGSVARTFRVTFEPGDSLGIVPENDPEMVEAVLCAAGLEGEALCTRSSLREFDITVLSRQVLEAYAALNPDPRVRDCW